MITDCSATIFKPMTNLGGLPPASEVVFPGLFGWSPISTTTLTKTLAIDRGLWATWRTRGITPAPMPATWFRPAPGRPLNYRVSDVLVWIAVRQGERLDALDTWRRSLRTGFETEAATAAEVRRWAGVFARAAGPTVGDVRFTPAGFDAYLAGIAG